MVKLLLSIACLGLLSSCASKQPEYINPPAPVSHHQTGDEIPDRLA